MTWRDKLEIGLKENAAFRKDNLPDFQVRGPEVPSGHGRSAEVPASRTDPTGPAEAAEAEEARLGDEEAALVLSDDGGAEPPEEPSDPNDPSDPSDG